MCIWYVTFACNGTADKTKYENYDDTEISKNLFRILLVSQYNYENEKYHNKD